MEMQMKIIYEGGQGEIVEKKSRFIATIRPAHSEEEAQTFIQEMKKKYWDARHNCSAYIIGRNREVERCSDDGEPSQTAGRPMLEILENAGIHDVVVVVTRYFGGTLLGTGGLVRAYQGAVQEGLKNCIIAEEGMGYPLKASVDYTALGKIEYIIREMDIPVMEQNYEEMVKFSLMVPSEQKKSFEEKVIEATSGGIKMEWSDEVPYVLMDGKVVI
jgi:uncharacterized YigZ family protein